MRTQRSSCTTITLFLLLLETVIGANWVIRLKAVEPILGWEDTIISLLEISGQNYHLYKAGIFSVILLVLIFLLNASRKPRKYTLPKI